MSEVEQDTGGAAAPKRARNTRWIVGGILLLIAAAAAMTLPRGYSDDLSHIGKGQATVVLVHNKNSPESIELMHVLDEVRGGYSGRVEFLLTEPNTPQGRAFMAANQVSQVTLALFDAGGHLMKVLGTPQTAENVRNEISAALGVKP